MVQEQYIFLHRAVLESLTCRDTCIENSQLEAVLTELSIYDPQLGCNGLEEEFAMLEAATSSTQHRISMQYSHKNGSMDNLRMCTFYAFMWL